MKNKRSWEVTYEEYKSPEKQARFKELQDKFNGKIEAEAGTDAYIEEQKAKRGMTREENDEYQKMKKIMVNLSKIDNLKEYMNRLETDFSKLKKEYNLREQYGKVKQREEFLEKDVSENMKKREEFMTKRKEINKRIAESKSPEEKEKLEAEKDGIDKELSDLKAKIDRNNKEFTDIKDKEGQYSFDKTLKDYSTEDLKYNCQQIRTTISKCNLVASNLMKGLSRDSIQPKLEGWKDRKLTSKNPLPIMKQNPAEAEKGRQGLIRLVKNENQKHPNTKNGNSQSLDNDAQSAQNGLPIKQYTFEEAFPRLAKLFPKLAENRVGKKMLEMKQKRLNKKAKAKEDNQSTDKNPPTNTKTESDKRKEFRSYIKYNVLDVADKGFETVRQEDLEKRREKREQMRPVYQAKLDEMKKQQMQAAAQKAQQSQQQDVDAR